MKLYKITSAVLHPIGLPFLATVIYLYKLPLLINYQQKKLVLLMVFGFTFVIPLITFLLLKWMGYIKTIKASSIAERKIPVLLMTVNYLYLGQLIKETYYLRELFILIEATAIGLLLTSILFYVRIKVSLHMLGMAGLLSFVLLCSSYYYYNSFLIALLIGLSGALATARLELKAHTLKEVILGTSFGLILPFLLSYIL